MCTPRELRLGVGEGTGCDLSGTPVWTSAPCGDSGWVALAVGAQSEATCVLESTLVDVVCCADTDPASAQARCVAESWACHDEACTFDTCTVDDTCTHTPECDDGDTCTFDECIDTMCDHVDKVCADDDACTKDSCDPDTGCVYKEMNCTDDNPFAGEYVCKGGRCVPSPGADCGGGVICGYTACHNASCGVSPGGAYCGELTPRNCAGGNGRQATHVAPG